MPATELPQREQQILKEECEGHYEKKKARKGICSDKFLRKGDVICNVENSSG